MKQPKQKRKDYILVLASGVMLHFGNCELVITKETSTFKRGPEVLGVFRNQHVAGFYQPGLATIRASA